MAPTLLLLTRLTLVLVSCFLAATPVWAQTICQSGYSQRVSFYNNCHDNSYIILTPPSDPTAAALWATVGGGFVSIDSGQYYRTAITAGQTVDLCIPDAGIVSGKFKFYLGCDGTFDSYGFPQNCAIGAAPGHTAFGVDSLFEFTGGCSPANTTAGTCNLNPSDNTPLGGTDYFDLSNVDGYTVPQLLQMVSTGDYQCTYTSMLSVTDLYSCPNENSATIDNATYLNSQLNGSGISLVLGSLTSPRQACMSTERWIEPPGGENPVNTNPITISPGITTTPPNLADWYACNTMPQAGADSNPFTCTTPGCGGPQCAIGPAGTPGDYSMGNIARGKGKPYTNYVKTLKATADQAYAWQFNDDASTMSCSTWGAKVLLTTCPGQTGQKPYNTQKWSYAGGACNVDTAGTYDTLTACQQANMRYVCSSEVVQKMQAGTTNVLQAQLNYCKPVAQSAVTPAVWNAAVSYARCSASGCQATGVLAASPAATDLLLLNQ